MAASGGRALARPKIAAPLSDLTEDDLWTDTWLRELRRPVRPLPGRAPRPEPRLAPARHGGCYDPGAMRALAVACLAAITCLPVLAQPPVPTVLSRLLWFDRAGQRIGALGPVADHGNLELSPDGTSVAVAVRDSRLGTFDIWIYETATEARRRFTSDEADENWLIWSPAGDRVLLNSFSADGLFLFEAPASGIGRRSPLVTTPGGGWPVSWSRDGRVVLYVTNSADTGNDIWVLPREGDARPYPFLRTRASENWAAFSPDGRWVAFSATDSGRAEVYVAPFPGGDRRWQISSDGGTQARWRADGTAIYYLAPDGMLVAVGVDGSGDELRVTGLDPLFRLAVPYGAYHAFDVTAAGDRFLVNTRLNTASPAGTAVRAATGGLEPVSVNRIRLSDR
jgi:hypothetical protein